MIVLHLSIHKLNGLHCSHTLILARGRYALQWSIEITLTITYLEYLFRKVMNGTTPQHFIIFNYYFRIVLAVNRHVHRLLF